MTPVDSRFLENIRKLNCWKRGAERAPHKPLLVLFALGRWAQFKESEIPYETIERGIGHLLRIYGPKRENYHPEYPFWRLQRDGIWRVPNNERFRTRKSNTDALPGDLRKKEAVGGFTEDVLRELESAPETVSLAAGYLLAEHFPATVHSDILQDVGLPGGEFKADYPGDIIKARRLFEANVRSAGFAKKVKDAYGNKCAICGFDASLHDSPCGTEAAHIQWHSHSGPDRIENGLALCPIHHKALDLGLIGIDNWRIRVSKQLKGGAAVRRNLIDYNGAPIGAPDCGSPPIGQRFVEWHRKQVFKGPPLPS